MTYKCPFCDSPDINTVTKNVMGEYTTWDCVCGAHGVIHSGKLFPNVRRENLKLRGFE